MGKHIVRDTITQLFAGSKGLLAMDESNPTCNKRFALAGIPQTIISVLRFTSYRLKSFLVS